MVSAAAGERPAMPDLHCPDCRRPRILDQTGGHVSCATQWCASAGSAVPLWLVLERADALDRTDAPDACPAGWPRPRHDGLPVPWITPVSMAGPQWRMIDRGRLARCQAQWLCQVCGLALPSGGCTAVITETGEFLTSAGTHPRCAALAARLCPAVRRPGIRVIEIARDQIRAGGQLIPELGQIEQWRIIDALS